MMKKRMNNMNLYTCEDCGEEVEKNQLDQDFFEEDTYICKNCSNDLLQAALEAVDPDHNFKSFEDWDEHGR